VEKETALRGRCAKNHYPFDSAAISYEEQTRIKAEKPVNFVESHAQMLCMNLNLLPPGMRMRIPRQSHLLDAL